MLETGDGIFLRVSSVQAFAENVSWERGGGDKDGRGSTRVQGTCFLKTICSASKSYIERGVVSENAEYLVIMRRRLQRARFVGVVLDALYSAWFPV